MDVSMIPALIEGGVMNSRDWVDWIAIGASVLSSFGILATIGVYFWQKKDNAKIKESKEQVLRDRFHEEEFILKTFLQDIEKMLIKEREIERKNNNLNGYKIKIQEIASSCLLFVNGNHVNVIIPSDTIIKILFSEAISCNSELSSIILKRIRLIERTLILYNHIKVKLQEDTIEYGVVKGPLMTMMIDSFTMLLQELE